MAVEPNPTDNPGSAGTPSAGGADDKDLKTGEPGDDPKDDTGDDAPVAYGTHKRLLRQHKSQIAREAEKDKELQGFRDAKANTEREKLESRGEYDKALDALRKENEKLTTANVQATKDAVDRRKLSAVLTKLPGKIDNSKYLGFVNLDDVAVDPDTGEVDTVSAQQSADLFVEEHGKLLVAASGAELPPGDPRPNGKMSHDAWKAMPHAERKKVPHANVAWPSENKNR